jgi:hypothetical protein
MRKLPASFLVLTALLSGSAQAAPAPKPAWPTVQRQLAADRVAPGTALDKLIRENQDFSLLRAEEMNDRRRSQVPLWLRVYWRKAHPGMKVYPLVLKEVHEWMVSHPNLPGVFSGSAGGISSLQAQSDKKKKPPKPTVSVNAGPDLRISPNEASTPRSESDIRINFWNTDQIVSASNDIEDLGALGIYYSGDGGGSWHSTSLPKQDSASFHSDPTVEWTSDGSAWATTLSIDASTRELVGHSYRSANGGATWTFAGSFSGDQTSVDKQMTWVDHFESSPFKDNLYVIYHNEDQVFVNRRNGPDGEWGEPLRVSGSETRGTGIGSDVKTNSAGTVFGFWPDTGTRKIFVVRSTNGGQSFSKPLAIGQTFASFDVAIPAMGRRRFLVYVTGGAFFRAAKKNMVYAAWADLAGGHGCSAPGNEPGLSRTAPCTSRIWFSRSSNGGNTWSRPAMIYNQKELNDQFNPWLAVDETTGNLAIMYYDSIGETRNVTNVWAQASLDDGATWSAPYKVTSEPTDESIGMANGNQYGDYNGMSGFAGTFFPSWTDRRDRGHEEVWTAPLTIEVKAAARSACPFSPLFADLASTADWSPEALTQPVCTPE